MAARKFNILPLKKWWLEDDPFPFWKAYFQRRLLLNFQGISIPMPLTNQQWWLAKHYQPGFYAPISTLCLSGWWFQTFFMFTPIWGNDIIFFICFQMGWFNHQLVIITAGFIFTTPLPSQLVGSRIASFTGLETCGVFCWTMKFRRVSHLARTKLAGISTRRLVTCANASKKRLSAGGLDGNWHNGFWMHMLFFFVYNLSKWYPICKRHSIDVLQCSI